MSGPILEAMTLDEAKAFAERLADMDGNKMEFIGSRRWDRYVVPAVVAALGLLKPEPDDDVVAVRKIMHAQQRAMTPPDSGWGNMSYLKGSYDDTEPFKAALAAYRDSRLVSPPPARAKGMGV
jgi:hypothetical protein